MSKDKKVRFVDCPKITLIAAVSENGYIGLKNGIPWKCKTDMKRFKDYTTGKPVLMGINTFESLPAGPLKNRLNIVVTKSESKVQAVVANFGKRFPGVEIPEVVNIANLVELRDVWPEIKENYGSKFNLDELIIAGGGNIYKQFIDLSDRVVLTYVKATVDGDVLFPKSDFQDGTLWTSVQKQSFFKDEDNEYDYKFYIFERPKKSKVFNLREKCEITKFDRLAEYELKRI